MLLAIGLTGGMTLLGMIPPLLMKYVVDEIVGTGQWHMAPAILVTMLLVNVLSAGGLFPRHEGCAGYLSGVNGVGCHLFGDIRFA